MAKVTIEIADDEILVALKRGEGYDDVHPQLVTEDAIGDRWPEYRTIEIDAARGDREMDELTQAQQFVVWYERICRDRDYAARYFDLANRISDDRKAVLIMLDWIEDHVKEIRQSFSEHFEIDWIGPHGDCTTRGESLRDAIRKGMESER